MNNKLFLIIIIIITISSVSSVAGYYFYQKHLNKNSTALNTQTYQQKLINVFNHGVSMEPHYKSEQSVMVDINYFLTYKPQRGDIILFKTPGKESIEVIKRIIGLPNETLEIKNGGIIINGKLLQENYLYENSLTLIDNTMDIFMKNGSQLFIPNGSYFVMGDNRKHSYDSRSFGLVNLSLIVGKVK